jgi:hypothetical protein
MATTSFPNWMPTQPNMGEMQSLYRQAPKAFSTKGVEDAYGQQMGYNMGQAQSTTANMAKAAQGRASRTGGQVAGSFAAGSAMLPYMQQNAQMLGDLEDYKLRAAQSRMQLQAGLAGEMAGLRQRGVGQMNDYFQSGENRSMAGDQFSRNLGQREREFAAQHALSLRQQSENESRYDDALSLQRSGGKGGPGGGLPSWGNVAAMMAAHNGALGHPQAMQYWQQMGQTASQAEMSDSPVFGTGSPMGYGGGGGDFGGGGMSAPDRRAAQYGRAVRQAAAGDWAGTGQY